MRPSSAEQPIFALANPTFVAQLVALVVVVVQLVELSGQEMEVEQAQGAVAILVVWAGQGDSAV